MLDEITIDQLTTKSVSVKVQNYTVINDVEYPIGQPHRRGYANSVRGRQAVQDELPEAQKNAIFAVWGDTPTVVESLD